MSKEEENKNLPSLSLEQLIRNEPVTINIPGIGSVQVREPTIGDRREARNEAMKLENWNKLSTMDQLDEITTRLVMKTIVSPKIEDLEKLKLNEFTAIIDTVAAYHGKRNRELTDQRRSLIEDFLGVKKDVVR